MAALVEPRDRINHAVLDFKPLGGTVGVKPTPGLFATWDQGPNHSLFAPSPTTQMWLVGRWCSGARFKIGASSVPRSKN